MGGVASSIFPVHAVYRGIESHKWVIKAGMGCFLNCLQVSELGASIIYEVHNLVYCVRNDLAVPVLKT